MSARILVMHPEVVVGGMKDFARTGHTLMVVEVPNDIAAQLQPGDVDLGAFAGSLLGDLASWRQGLNRVRAAMSLEPLSDARLSDVDCEGTRELVAHTRREADRVGHLEQRLREAHATIERLQMQTREDGRTINSLRVEVADLETDARMSRRGDLQ